MKKKNGLFQSEARVGVATRVDGSSSSYIKAKIFYYIAKCKPNMNNNRVKKINPNTVQL